MAAARFSYRAVLADGSVGTGLVEATDVAAATASKLGHALMAFPSDQVLLIACLKCGAYAQTQGVKLARPCPGQLATAAAKRVVRRLQSVPPRHPDE